MPHAKAGEINLEYYVEGSGPPLLLIMGYTGQASSWGEPILRLLRERFTVIRFSNRGTGTSDRPETPTTIRVMADDAAALLGAIGIERPHVFGVSMGGMIAQELVLSHPRRVNGLVLGCTAPGGPNTATAGPDIMTMLMPVPGMAREDQVRKAWPAICAAEFINGSSRFLEEMLVEALRTPTPLDTVGKQMVAIQAFDAYERLPQIKAPTLVIHGDADLLVPPANGRLIHERIPGSRLVMLPGAGHMFFWEQPEVAAEVVTEFLASVPVAA